MRKFSVLALTTLLLLPSALAETSTGDTYDRASMTVTASGAYGEAVNFEVPDTALNLDASALRPGATYTISVPVTNTTDRPIVVTGTSAVTGSYQGNVIVTAVTGSLTLAPGGTGELQYTIGLPSDAAISATAGKTVTVTFSLEGTSDYS
ncbi:hypothetical protein GO986_15285 [Deinococcus sp. HMF7620]|uniref:DUF11 domain-containing protein n=1 Tax=Deinococcus arboris TaxID=2682977 RepID=A0A7C9I0T3_9DEIO|nr:MULTISPECIES: hypothetical protein [Deinococcus]MBZ9750315.1 DUF916 domain-containing protein [Deinococcus betulae]MVN88115.1 hypothetical protein [Deinococcus arboris]